jgi:hypothetical protein
MKSINATLPALKDYLPRLLTAVNAAGGTHYAEAAGGPPRIGRLL